MRVDLTKWCRSCVRCATRGVGRPVRPPLTPIPVAGPFDRVGVDVLQLPSGKRYAVVFMDYLTKWPEVFATADQTALTIDRLLVEEIICCHGVPNQLMSDRGPSFLSKLVLEVCSMLGIKKLNTSAYHPQSDGLVERFNRTLTDMLAKTAKNGADWDTRLPYVLFAYRATVQASTVESPFLLLYGRDPRLPTELLLSPPVERCYVNLDDYKFQMVRVMREVWMLAQKALAKAQHRQKVQHDKSSNNADFQVGDRVFVFMPGMKSGPAYNLSCPYKGPYHIMAMYPNGAEVVLIDLPREPTIRVALNRVHRDPTMDVAVTQLAPVSEQPALDASMPENVSDSEQSASATGLGLQETVSNPDL